MKSFFRLVGFEYKKLFLRKSTMFSLFLVVASFVILNITSVSGNGYWHYTRGISRLEAMRLDREIIRGKAGVIDEEFIREAILQNAAMISNDENYLINDYGRHLKSDAYIKYVLPYEKAVSIINCVYESDIQNLSTDGFRFFNLNVKKPIDALTPEDADSFYASVNNALIENIRRMSNLTQNEIDKHYEMLSKVKTPYYNDHYDGYLNFNKYLHVIALVLLINTAICIAPIFADEYYLKVDQIILSSKYGKNKVISAKLFAGVLFTLIISIAALSGLLLSMLLIHGFGGYGMSIQTISAYSTYPLTVGQASLTAIIASVFIIMSFAMLSMLFSALSKSPFSAVITSFLIIFIPGILNISAESRFIYQLLQTFPAKAANFDNIYSNYLFEISDIVFTPPVFYIAFSTIIFIVIVPMVKYFFKNHEIL